MLDVLFWGLKASPVAWTSFKDVGLEISKLQFLKKKTWIFFSCTFFQIFVMKTVGLDALWPKMRIRTTSLKKDATT